MKKFVGKLAAVTLLANVIASGTIVFATEGVEIPEVAVVDPENEITVLDAGVEVTEEATTEAAPEQVAETTEDEAEPTENTVAEKIEVAEESEVVDESSSNEEPPSGVDKLVPPSSPEDSNPETGVEPEKGEENTTQPTHDPVVIAAFIEELRDLREDLVAKQSNGWTSTKDTIDSMIEYLDNTIYEYLNITDLTLDSEEIRSEFKQIIVDFINSLVPPQTGGTTEQPQQPEQPKEDKFLEEIKKLREELKRLYHSGYSHTTISYEEISLLLADVEGILSEGGSLEESTKEEILRKFQEFKKQLVPPTTGETPEPENPGQGEQPKPEENPKLEAPKPGETPKPEEPEAPKPEAPKPGETPAPEVPGQGETPTLENPKPSVEAPKEQKAETLPNTGDAGSLSTLLGILALAGGSILRRRTK